jgi:hypothetical protein
MKKLTIDLASLSAKSGLEQKIDHFGLPSNCKPASHYWGCLPSYKVDA